MRPQVVDFDTKKDVHHSLRFLYESYVNYLDNPDGTYERLQKSMRGRLVKKALFLPSSNVKSKKKTLLRKT